MGKKALYAAAWLVLLFGIGACQAAPVETTDPADGLRPLTVEAVQVEIGVGSPIPVEVVASGSWPDLCAQLARVEQTIARNRIVIRLLATPADEGCPPDHVGLPFRIAVPLNIVEMEQGTYSVDVNGVGTTFVWPQDTPEPPGALDTGPYTVAYLGSGGNLWIGPLHGMGHRQVTTDGTALTGGLASDREVNYYMPRISSDGRYVAVRRDEGQTVVGGVEYTFSLMVYDLETGEAFQVFDQTPAGFDWKPGTHLAGGVVRHLLAGVVAGRPLPCVRRGLELRGERILRLLRLRDDDLSQLGRGYRAVRLVTRREPDRLRPHDLHCHRRGAHLPARSGRW